MAKDKVYRFSMGSAEDPCSTTWRIWTQSAEAYLSVRVMATVVKFSLHSSGIWLLQIDQAVRRWQRPKAFRPGWVRGPIIVIPHNDLEHRRPYLDPNPSEKSTWLSQPARGSVSQIELYFRGRNAAGSSWDVTDLPGHTLLASLDLAGGDTLHIARFDRPLLSQEGRDIEMRRTAFTPRPGPGPDGELFGFSGFTVTNGTHGSIVLFETQHEVRPLG